MNSHVRRVILLALLLPVMYRPAAGAITPPSGSWIWNRETGSTRCSYTYFRRSFTLDSAPLSASVKVAADSRYILYVNGQRVGRGSSRCFKAHQYYDTWDIRPYLNAGQNVIAALVHFYGEGTLQYQIGRPGFLCDASIITSSCATAIRSDSTWRALLSKAWDRTQPRMSNGVGYADLFDARLEPAGWTQATFDDSTWPAAQEIGAAGMPPWTDLTPLDIPVQRETPVRAASVVMVQQVSIPRSTWPINLAKQTGDSRTTLVGFLSTWVYSPTAVTVTFQLASSDPDYVWLNGVHVLDRCYGGGYLVGMQTATVSLPAGWSRLLVKSVRRTTAWTVDLAFMGSGASALIVSALKDVSAPDTWRVGPTYTYPVPGVTWTPYITVYPPETDPDDSTWTQFATTMSPIPTPSRALRWAARSQPSPPLVTNAASLLKGDASAVFATSSTGCASVILDMGKEVFGYPVIQISQAVGGEVVEASYGETLEDDHGALLSPLTLTSGALNPEREGVRQTDVFTCRPGANTFEPFEKKAFRYIELDVRTNGRPLTVSQLYVKLSTYPVQERGSFSCSDARLTRLWEMGRWTTLLNMDDAFTDCPWRERGQWWGDARVSALTNYYCFGDAALVRHGLIQGAQSQDSEGVLQGVFPNDWDQRMPSYMLMWVFSIWDYVLYTGDVSACPMFLPTIERIVSFLDKHTSASRGLLEDVPYWVYIDWLPGMDYVNVGANCTLNCLYYQALRCTAKMALAANDCVAATRYSRKAESLKAAINKYMWNPSEHYYNDPLVNGAGTGVSSQHANSCALAFGVAPPDRYAEIANRMFAAPAMYRPGPYFTSYVLEGLEAAGQTDLALKTIRDSYAPMLDFGSSTTWESFYPCASLAHAFSSSPTRYLSSAILGLRPISPGWKDWRFEPSWGDLTWAKGVVPTPQGDISASWTLATSSLAASVTVPEGTVGHVRMPTAGMTGWHWKVNGSDALPDGVTAENANGAWALRIAVAGTYSISATP
ncbi:MAG TPA: family 78 glycoside hydrolase catalytic domain [Armatimonadota bacterium]|jgi:hypothetical protein